MSTAIPESFTYSLLSRLPANSFVVNWKEFRPDTAPLNPQGGGRFYVVQGNGVQQERVRIHIRGSPNEFLLNTNCYLLASSQAETVQQAEAVADETDNVFTNEGLYNIQFGVDRVIQNADQIDYFSGSRESFNSGALPYLDNQDRTGSHAINRLRSVLSRRNQKDIYGNTKEDMKGCLGGTRNNLLSVAGRGPFEPINYRAGDGKNVWVVGDSTANGGAPPTNQWAIASNGSNYLFQIPLGYYSNLINSHSVVPIGLMSSYSVNGYSIELTTTADQLNAGWSGAFTPSVEFPVSDMTQGTGLAAAPFTVNFINSQRRLSEIRIWAPVVQILDPAVMDSILSLYEKRQMVSLGGVQFPLSLRMNSLAYRFSQFPIRNGTADYHFRIAGTDRSVRGLAWWIAHNGSLNEGLTSMPNLTSVKVTRLQTKIGNEHIHEVVEDQTPLTDNVNNFLNVNTRKSGALWSPHPQYLEAQKFDDQPEDDLYAGFNNIRADGLQGQPVNPFPELNDGAGNVGYRVELGKRALSYGVISFENLDRREGDHQGSYQASGKDLTNVGSIELDMRVQRTVQVPLSTDQTGTPTQEDTRNRLIFEVPNDNYTIYFAYCYDSIFEISPSGVMDISNAVL